MLNTLFLVSLVVALIVFLVWRRTPRAIAFQILLASSVIFTIAFWMTLGAVGRLNPDMLYGLAPYLPPIIPVAAFVAWSSRRTRVSQR